MRFLLAGTWHLIGGPSATTAAHRGKVLLTCPGSGIAVAAWLAAAPLLGRWRLPIIVLSLAAIAAAGIDSLVAFDADEGMLVAGRIERGRFVHDGLGFSCAVFQNCRLKTRPFLHDAKGQERGPPKRIARG